MKLPIGPAAALWLSAAFCHGSPALPPLKYAFQNDFLIGAAVNESQFTGRNAVQANLLKTQFNTITPENTMKWEHIHPEPDRYDFSRSDLYVDFGVKNHMVVIGHTLVWHSQTPDWVFKDDKGGPVTREMLLDRMSRHIHAVVGRYKGRIKGWDVVNEALNEDGTLRQSPWLKIIGDDYIAKAFEFAHDADPKAELYYNDYSLENPSKRNGAIALVSSLRARGVSIAGVGIQSHVGMGWPSLGLVDDTLTAFGKLGVKVMITEFDVDVLPQPNSDTSADVSRRVAGNPVLDPFTGGLPEAKQQELARRYADLFTIYLKHRGTVSRVTFWGLTDGDSWLNDWPVKGRTSHPLLFDRAGNPKPAYAAVIRAAIRADHGGNQLSGP